jgi:hypothetical protein
MENSHESAWSIIWANLTRMPWANFLLSMFVPLTIMEIGRMMNASLISVYISLAWLALVAILMYVIKREIDVMAIMTFVITLTRLLAAFLVNVHTIFALVPSLDNFVLGLIFVGSMLRPRPYVMSLVGKETIEHTEAKFGKSKFFFKAWFDINIVWGLFYIFEGIIVSYALALRVETGELFDFLFGWPMVLVLLYFSVDYPGRYWKKHWAKMQIEIEAAKEYEAKQTTSA